MDEIPNDPKKKLEWAVRQMRGENLIQPISDDWECHLRSTEAGLIKGYELVAWEKLREGSLSGLIDLLKSGTSNLHPALVIELVHILSASHSNFKIKLVGTKRGKTLTPLKVEARRNLENSIRLRLLQEGYLKRSEQASSLEIVSEIYDLSPRQLIRIWNKGKKMARRIHRGRQRYNEAIEKFGGEVHSERPPEFSNYLKNIPTDWKPKKSFSDHDLAEWVRMPFNLTMS